MRRCALGAGSVLVLGSALPLSFSPASGASGFHCPWHSGLCEPLLRLYAEGLQASSPC